MTITAKRAAAEILERAKLLLEKIYGPVGPVYAFPPWAVPVALCAARDLTDIEGIYIEGTPLEWWERACTALLVAGAVEYTTDCGSWTFTNAIESLKVRP